MNIKDDFILKEINEGYLVGGCVRDWLMAADKKNFCICDRDIAIKNAESFAQKLAEQSIVTTEGYSIVDEEKFAEEMKTETSNARGTFVRTNLRLGGLIGEVIKKSKFTDKLNKARKLTIKETEKYNKSSVIKGILLGIIIGLLTFILT